jgi:hypothetical protein
VSVSIKSFVTVFAKLASFDQSTMINALARGQVGLAIIEALFLVATTSRGPI